MSIRQRHRRLLVHPARNQRANPVTFVGQQCVCRRNRPDRADGSPTIVDRCGAYVASYRHPSDASQRDAFPVSDVDCGPRAIRLGDDFVAYTGQQNQLLVEPSERIAKCLI